MSDGFRIEGIEKLVLAWLLVPRKRPAMKDLVRSLKPFVHGTGASAESVARQCLARLKARGDIDADTTWILSAAGQEKALRTVGLSSVPKRMDWRSMHRRLVACGNGTEITPPALRQIGAAEGLASAVIRREFGIRVKTASPAQVANALAWRELGVESSESFTRTAVLTHILRKTRPQAEGPKDMKSAIRELAAAVLDISPEPDPLREAMIRRWMGSAAALPAGESNPVVRTPQPIESDEPRIAAIEANPAELARFAARALTAARASTTGRWGENKVFISHVWEQVQRQEGGPNVGLGTFKRLLVLANRRELLSLSRADLVEAMDSGDVQRSEIDSLGTKFHFVKIG